MRHRNGLLLLARKYHKIANQIFQFIYIRKKVCVVTIELEIGLRVTWLLHRKYSSMRFRFTSPSALLCERQNDNL